MPQKRVETETEEENTAPSHEDPDADLMKGHPAQGEDEDEGPILVDVEVGGRKLQVTEDVAAAIEAERSAMRDRQTSAPAPTQMDVDTQPVQQPKSEKGEEEDLSTLWYTDPKRAAQIIKEEVRQELTQAYTQEQAQRTFWERFDKLNPGLENAHEVARSVYNQNADRLGSLKGDDGIKALGAATKEFILGIAGTEGDQTQGNKTASLEGGSGRKASKNTEASTEQPKEPVSISKALAQRRQARAKGAA